MGWSCHCLDCLYVYIYAYREWRLLGVTSHFDSMQHEIGVAVLLFAEPVIAHPSMTSSGHMNAPINGSSSGSNQYVCTVHIAEVDAHLGCFVPHLQAVIVVRKFNVRLLHQTCLKLVDGFARVLDTVDGNWPVMPHCQRWPMEHLGWQI